jgi:hypothetical protein
MSEPQPPSHSEPHPHVIELQERVAFLERDIETLDGVVRELAGRLEVTVRELTRLREDTAGRLEEVVRTVGEAGLGGGGVDEGGPGGTSGSPAGADPGNDPFTRDMPPHWGRATGRGED